MLQNAFVNGARPEASANYKYGFLLRFKSELLSRLLFCQFGVEQSLPHGISGFQDLISRKETLHAVVCDANTPRLLGKELVGYARVRVLFLYKTWYSHLCTLVKRRAAGVASHSDSCHRLELAYYFLSHALALPYFIKHLDVAQHVLPVEAADGQPLYLVACCGHALHLHAPQSAHKEYFRIRMFCLYGVCDGYGREYVPPGASSAYDYSQFTFHTIIHLLLFRKSKQNFSFMIILDDIFPYLSEICHRHYKHCRSLSSEPCLRVQFCCSAPELEL